jgi:hypothetical protein
LGAHVLTDMILRPARSRRYFTTFNDLRGIPPLNFRASIVETHI